MVRLRGVLGIYLRRLSKLDPFRPIISVPLLLHTNSYRSDGDRTTVLGSLVAQLDRSRVEVPRAAEEGFQHYTEQIPIYGTISRAPLHGKGI